jgi:hypothetical protein
LNDAELAGEEDDSEPDELELELSDPEPLSAGPVGAAGPSEAAVPEDVTPLDAVLDPLPDVDLLPLAALFDPEPEPEPDPELNLSLRSGSRDPCRDMRRRAVVLPAPPWREPS